MQFQNECIAQTCSRAPPNYFLKVILDESRTEAEKVQDQILHHGPVSGSSREMMLEFRDPWTIRFEDRSVRIGPNWSEFFNLSGPGPVRSCGSLLELKMS